jgi:hypothetical protein
MEEKSISLINKNKLKFLNKAKSDFISLSKKSRCKARLYKAIDLIIKIIISIGGAIITYFSDPNNAQNTINLNILRALGIAITSVTALSSVFMFEKRSLSNIQIYTKCSNIVPEIEDKLERKDFENVKNYVKSIYKELSLLSIASFTDSLSSRHIKNEEEE